MKNSYFDIRPETLDDAEIITHILNMSFGLDRATKASYRLREGSRRVAELAFIVELNGRVIGTIQFWPIVLGRTRKALLLGPLAILPSMQGFGAGRLLIEHGVQSAAAAGHELVILVGEETYYGKAGFRRIEGNVLMPGPFDPARLLFRELKQGAGDRLEGMILPPHRL